MRTFYIQKAHNSLNPKYPEWYGLSLDLEHNIHREYMVSVLKYSIHWASIRKDDIGEI